MEINRSPRIFHVFEENATALRDTPFGRVGSMYGDGSIEAVWVKKQNEQIDPDWFSQDTVDLIVVMKGELKVEYADKALQDAILEPGDMLVLPPKTPCRAFHWPRDDGKETIFIAVYPKAIGKTVLPTRF